MADLSQIYESLFSITSQNSVEDKRSQLPESFPFQTLESRGTGNSDRINVSDDRIKFLQELETSPNKDNDYHWLPGNDGNRYSAPSRYSQPGRWLNDTDSGSFASLPIIIDDHSSQSGMLLQSGYSVEDSNESESDVDCFSLDNIASCSPPKKRKFGISNDGVALEKSSSVVSLRSVAEIPEKYRRVFCNFPYFNIIQSRVFDDVFYSDSPIVVSAPTGSGKTVIFELAIIRFLMQHRQSSSFKFVYMAPIKALCNERLAEWKTKFGPLGLDCTGITGDSDTDDYFELQKFSIILTTPEKWDSLTRRWQGANSFVKMIRIFMIDEIHLLNDESRGATLEAVVTRMKTMENLLSRQGNNNDNSASNLRFLAVSATMPNVQDVAEWLSSGKQGCTYKMNDELRPVQLKRVVLGYPFHSGWTEFKFDISLSYKLGHVINSYSERKPCLVFCSTRKGVIQTASILAKEAKFVCNSGHKQLLTKEANMLRDNKLREAVLCGIGFHHAGLDTSDRRSIEGLFVKGVLPVLISTSTLAMGVNLPAHLVIIKSTTQYKAGCYEEYSEIQIVQMMGRAGRPQYDATATVVIMTKHCLKPKYEALISGTQIIESNLHKHLVEHLNAEIVLHTITDVSIAMEWIRSTFLYIRIMKNPKHYGIPIGLKKEQVEKKLHEICLRNLNALAKYKFIAMDDDSFVLRPTEIGHLMTKYCTAFETMKNFSKVEGTESISDLIRLISDCKEFEDILLRTSEKKCLNLLNKNKNKASIRYPASGKINTCQLKINCLIQATFGCLPVADVALNQDMLKIIKIGQRIARCLADYLMIETRGFQALLNAVILAKCFRAHLWENSKYVSRQLDKIGVALSDLLVSSGITSFQAIENTNPRELEMILSRNPPFGNYIHDAVVRLPKYHIAVEQRIMPSRDTADLSISVYLENHKLLQDKSTASYNHSCILIVGDKNNKVLLKQRILDSVLIKTGQWTKRIQVHEEELRINLISEYYVGLDKESIYIPYYPKDNQTRRESGTYKGIKKKEDTLKQRAKTISSTLCGNNTTCNHHCKNKTNCGHQCCKVITSSERYNIIGASFRSDLDSNLKMPISKRIKVMPSPSIFQIVNTSSSNKHTLSINENVLPLVSKNTKNSETLPNSVDVYANLSEHTEFDYSHQTSGLTYLCNSSDSSIRGHKTLGKGTFMSSSSALSSLDKEKNGLLRAENELFQDEELMMEEADYFKMLNHNPPFVEKPKYKENDEELMMEEDGYFKILDQNPPFFEKPKKYKENAYQNSLTVGRTQGKVIAWKVDKNAQAQLQNQPVNAGMHIHDTNKETKVRTMNRHFSSNSNSPVKQRQEEERNLEKSQWVPPDKM